MSESKSREEGPRKGSRRVKASRMGQPAKPEDTAPSAEALEVLRAKDAKESAEAEAAAAELAAAEAAAAEADEDSSDEDDSPIRELVDPAESLEDRLSRLDREQAASRAEMVEEDRLRRQAARKADAEAQLAEAKRKAKGVAPLAERLRDCLQELSEVSEQSGPVQLDTELMGELRRSVRSLRASSRRLRWSLRF